MKNVERKGRIIVIENDTPSLDIVTDILVDEQYCVTSLKKLPSLQELKEFEVDLILLDIFLGDQDGRVFCSRLRSFPEFSKIPIILFSAYNIEKSEVERIGATDFIRKPFELYNFLETIESNMQLTKSSNQ